VIRHVKKGNRITNSLKGRLGWKKYFLLFDLHVIPAKDSKWLIIIYLFDTLVQIINFIHFIAYREEDVIT